MSMYIPCRPHMAIRFRISSGLGAARLFDAGGAAENRPTGRRHGEAPELRLTGPRRVTGWDEPQI